MMDYVYSLISDDKIVLDYNIDILKKVYKTKINLEMNYSIKVQKK